VPGIIFRTPTMMLVRLAVPILAIWIAIQWELWQRRPAITS
jgi:hypothetical protein